VRYENVVWEGRFQPIHRGHVEYVRLLLEQARRLWVFVVENELSTEVVPDPSSLPVPAFSSEVDRHHGAEKNPLPFWLRYRLVVETLSEELPGAPIVVWGGRRLDLDWPLYSRTLPPDRVFLTPLRDGFEDLKAAAWEALGEEVVRVDVSRLPAISATQLRAAIREGGDLSRVLCPSTERVLRESGWLSRLAGEAAAR
jgi:hypothetical protein